MSDEIKIDGVGVAPGVLDTIVTLAAQSVDGVAAVGAPGLAGFVQRGLKGAARPVDVTGEVDELSVTVRINVEYGKNLRAVAREVQAAVHEALASQVGVEAGVVDVFVDAIVFSEQ